MPEASKPEARGFTFKGRASSQHGLSCQHLGIWDDPPELAFLRTEGEEKAAGRVDVQSNNWEVVDLCIQQTANSLPCRPSSPAGLESTGRHAELGAGPGLADQKETGSVNTGT